MKKTQLENIDVTIELEEGIVIAKWKSSFVDLKVAKQAVKWRLECTNFTAYPLLTNIKQVKSSTKEARDFLATEKGCEGIIAAAVLIDSPISSMIGNFFIRVSKPLRPTKIFTNEAEAKNWLAQFIKKD